MHAFLQIEIISWSEITALLLKRFIVLYWVLLSHLTVTILALKNKTSAVHQLVAIAYRVLNRNRGWNLGFIPFQLTIFIICWRRSLSSSLSAMTCWMSLRFLRWKTAYWLSLNPRKLDSWGAYIPGIPGKRPLNPPKPFVAKFTPGASVVVVRSRSPCLLLFVFFPLEPLSSAEII